MYRTIVAGTLALTLSYIPSIAHPKKVNCEEHLGSRIGEMEFLDKVPEPQRQKGMLFRVPQPAPGVSRSNLIKCIKERVEEISANGDNRYSIYPYPQNRNFYVIGPKK